MPTTPTRLVISAGFAIVALTIAVFAQETPNAPDEQPAETTSQPDTQPAARRSTLRTPEQARILEQLLRDQERARPILPQSSADRLLDQRDSGKAGQMTLLLEGTMLIERPGRFVVENGRPKFVFQIAGGGPELRSMEINPSQLLETMERAAKGGITEFTITAEVTRYHGRNYLNLKKVLRRVGNGNLSP